MNQPNFGSLLDKPSTEIERPRPLPQGTYICVIKGLPKQDKSTKKQTEYVEFTYQPIQAGEDVDQEELQAMGGIADKTIRDTYYLTDNAIWRLNEMLDACGISRTDDNEEPKSNRQRIGETPGKQLAVYIKHTASEDGKNVYANVGSVAAVE